MTSRLEIRFVSSNPHKIAEAQKILGNRIVVTGSDSKIEELQTIDIRKLVRHKVLKAFEKIGRPLFVEHTGLYLEHLKGLPGGLTQIFWDTLEAERFAELFGKLAPNTKATAKTFIAYCDGRKIHEFEGKIDGVITPEPRGPCVFQWDCVFQPASQSQTFAEMGDKKNEISMRREALERLALHLTKGKTDDHPVG